MVRDFFVQQFDRLDNKKACLVTSGRTPEEQFYIEESRRELQDLGIVVDEVNIALEKDVSKLPAYDIYYVCGGNTFYILDRMQKTGMDKVLMQAIADGKFYLGVSAGSMIPGPDIVLAGKYGEEDANHVGLHNTTSFGATTCFVLPHHEKSQDSIALEFQSHLMQEHSIVGITDNQALFVTDDQVFLIGVKEECLLIGNIENIRDKTIIT